MKLGDRVKVRDAYGQLLVRRVVNDIGRTVIVCHEAEFQAANKEGREPDGIGFPRADVEAC